MGINQQALKWLNWPALPWCRVWIRTAKMKGQWRTWKTEIWFTLILFHFWFNAYPEPNSKETQQNIGSFLFGVWPGWRRIQQTVEGTCFFVKRGSWPLFQQRRGFQTPRRLWEASTVSSAAKSSPLSSLRKRIKKNQGQMHPNDTFQQTSKFSFQNPSGHLVPLRHRSSCFNVARWKPFSFQLSAWMPIFLSFQTIYLIWWFCLKMLRLWSWRSMSLCGRDLLLSVFNCWHCTQQPLARNLRFPESSSMVSLLCTGHPVKDRSRSRIMSALCHNWFLTWRWPDAWRGVTLFNFYA